MSEVSAVLGLQAMTATFYVGDAVTVMNTLPEKSIDLILTSPPFLALRSYLPSDHPDKALEGGSQATPGEYIDWLLDVVEACARVLAPHGSLCFELGDTYAGSMPLVRASSDTEEWVAKFGRRTRAAIPPTVVEKVGDAWPLAKSLSLIPETFRFAMVYGHNPHTGRTTPPWRLRNVIRWVRPNPPVGALGDKFRPATSELMVFCKAKDRFFDLDAVREPGTNTQFRKVPHGGTKGDPNGGRDTLGPYAGNEHPAGAPPLDWWNIPPGGYPGAHYAVWPPELLVKPIKAMCPEKVCRRCGEASRRIVNDRSAFDAQPALAAHIKSQREAKGLTSDEVNGWFGFKEIAKNWERTDQWGAAIPNAAVWPLLKERLSLSDTFDALVMGDRKWTESTIEYVDDDGQSKPPLKWESGISKGKGAHSDKPGSLTRIAPEVFTDCGHDDYRPGIVLDPFAGSGTTLSVATGHGRDAIGIDLDERNYELSLDRVGPLILERGTEPARRINS